MVPQTITARAPNVAPRATLVASNSDPPCRYARVEIVGSDAGPEDNVVIDGHSLEDHHLVLDGDAVTDDRAPSPVGAIADIAVTPHFGTFEHMRKCPIRVPNPDGLAFAQALRMNEDIVVR